MQFGTLVMNADIAGHYVRLVLNVLTLFVLIELSRSLVSHFDEHRLRLTFIVDTSIVFVLREIMLKLFEHKISPDQIYTLVHYYLFLVSYEQLQFCFQREKQNQSISIINDQLYK